MSPQPEYYREIGNEFFDELLALLLEKKHVALLGPRQGGKALLLTELSARATRLPEADRPQVVRLIGHKYSRSGPRHLLERVAAELGTELPAPVAGVEQPLSGALEGLYRSALARSNRTVWLFVQNILGFPAPLVRELLHSFGLVNNDDRLRRRLAVVVTGGGELVPLTFGSVSPYRHARQFLVQGMDRDCARDFLKRMRDAHFVREACSTFMDQATESDREAFEELYQQTGGGPHLIEELMFTAARHFNVLRRAAAPPAWNVQYIRDLTRTFIDECMINDYYSRLSLREVEREPQQFELLLRVLREDDGRVAILGKPTLLEVCGLVRRDERSLGWLTCPIWRRFLEAFLDTQHVADIYGRQHRWDNAWREYEKLPREERDRPISGEARNRFQAVIRDWEESLIGRVTEGREAVREQLFLGARHLLGFDVGGLYEGAPGSAEQKLMAQFGTVPAGAAEPINQVYRRVCAGTHWQLFLSAERLRLKCLSQSPPFASHVGQFVLYLERHGLTREVVVTDQAYICQALDRFWHAFHVAYQFEYGELRKRHLQVIERVNRALLSAPGPGQGSFDMGRLVRETVDALVEDGNYYRAQLSLVDPRRERIQGVASRCKDRDRDFNFRTDYPLHLHTPLVPEDDVDVWVVRNRRRCVIPDAASPDQLNPSTYWTGARQLGMKCITVVPMMVQEEVIGTMHLERPDLGPPSDAELSLFDVLASHLAVVFHHSRQLSLLQQALLCMTDRIRILDPNGRPLFLNAAATQPLGERQAGWQPELITPGPDGALEPGPRSADLELIQEVEGSGGPAHLYHLGPGPNHERAADLLVAPIDDFRSSLPPPYEVANGRIGYVTRAHDLTELYGLYEALQEWLSEHGARATTQKALSFFQRAGHSWCRIYLLRKPEEGGPILESYEELGLPEDVRALFLRGGVTFRKGDGNPQPWHAMEHASGPVIYSHSPMTKTIQEGHPSLGVPAYLAPDPVRKLLRKTDDSWIEAALRVGARDIGLISLAIPPDFSPSRYELLKSAILAAAVALDDAVRAEEEAQRAEEAWKSAAQMTVHQLTNKLAPVEAFLTYAAEDVHTNPEEARQNIELALPNLTKARSILQDFRRYASEKPFEDRARADVAALLDELAAEARRRHPGLRSVRVVERPTCPAFVEVSRQAMVEVVEVLANNSVMHSKKDDEQLELTLGAVVLPAAQGAPSSTGEMVRLEYRDNGQGVPERLRREIFKAYFTTHSMGSGLGLSIAQRYIKRQGGHLIEEGSPERPGACFAIYLPLLQRAAT